MLQGEVDGDRSAPCHPDHICALDAQVVEQVGDVLTVRKRNILGELLSEATRIVANNAELLSEDWKLGVAHPAVGDAVVNQQKGLSPSCYFIVQPCAVDLYESSLTF